jgi:flagella basal body P-ring formation protein FlgA
MLSIHRVIPLVLLPVLAATGGNAGAEEACRAVSADWILGRDLAAAVPALADLPPDLPVSYAPVPGLQRVFHPDELRRLAAAHHLEDPHLQTNICFVWPLVPLSRDAIRMAMQKTLAGRNPVLEILDENRAEVPDGELIFPLSGLSAASDKPVIWKGYVAYAASRRFNTWASVRIRIHETHLVANGLLHHGDRMNPRQWRAENYEGPLTRDQYFADAAQVAGLVARRDIANGSVLLNGMFEVAKDVERGDLVSVLVESGSARIETQGIAELAGRRGDIIPVRNPRSGVQYKARIEDQSKVLVVPGGAAGLVVDEKNGAPAPMSHAPSPSSARENKL